MAECSIADCRRAVFCRGWCSPHYYRWHEHGDPTSGGPMRLRSVSERLDRHTVVGEVPEFRPDLGPCWVWTGAVDPRGYGRVYGRRAGELAHRVSYEHHVGPIPDGLPLDHLCRVPACVNPSHLEPVTSAENTRRGLAARGYPTIPKRKG